MTRLVSFQLHQPSQHWATTQPEDHPSSSTVALGLNAWQRKDYMVHKAEDFWIP